MQTIPQVKRDITYQECSVSGQSLSPYADCSSPPVYQPPFPTHVAPPPSQNLQCHTMTTYQSSVTQAPSSSSGKSKWKTNSIKQAMHRHSYPPQVPAMPPTPMLFSAYASTPTYPDPRGQLLPPYDPYYYTTQPQHYYPSNYHSGNLYPNGYRPQLQSPPPRPYLTITQFNYQPIGYHTQQAQPSTPTNLVFGPPPRDRRCSVDTHCRYYSSNLASQFDLERPVSPTKNDKLLELSNTKPKLLYMNTMIQNNEEKINSLRTDDKSDSSGSFEFTIQPEQIVNSLCDEKDQECVSNRTHTDILKTEEENLASHLYGSPRMWPECDTMNPMRIEDDELTKFIVDGCLKAETIALRNQHRPCFKNIKHLCTRTRTDILKPRTTVANIHSQGIPWATKDFIFAFVRLINCWYILKGYLDDHDGSLGKIETTLTSEFKECYQRWQNNNKEMVRHLINIFVNLDNGITVQNAEIFSTFNHVPGNVPANNCMFPNDIQTNENQNKPISSQSCTSKFAPEQTEYQMNKTKLQSQSDIFLEANKFNISELFTSDMESCLNLKLKHSHSEGRMSVPGILRVKEIFNTSTSANTSPRNDEDTDSDKECRHKIYMKPGSYRVPKKTYSSPQNVSPSSNEVKDRSSLNEHLIESMMTHDSQEKTFSSTQNVSNLDSSNMNRELCDSQISDTPTPDDVWRNALESIGPFIRTVLQDTESSYGSPANLSQRPDRTSQSNESSEKECEQIDNTLKHKSYRNTKDTQAWVDEHCFENCMDENIEEVTEKPKKIEKRVGKNPTRKNHVNTRTYRKKSDDLAIIKKPSKYKSCDNSYNQNSFLNKKNCETNVLTSMCFLSRRHLGMSSLTISKFEKIISALWNHQFAKYITFEVNVENIPDYYKYVRKPMFLCKVMNNLKQNKYNHPHQVVHDLKSIVRNSELYIEELESQLADKFTSLDFSSVTGEYSQSSSTEEPAGSHFSPDIISGQTTDEH